MTVCGTGNWGGPQPGDPDNNITLTATSAFGGIEIRVTYPLVNPEAVAYFQLFRGTTNSLVAAVPRAQFSGDYFFDNLNDNLQYFYWIRIISVHGTEGAWVGPASAVARPLVDDLLSELSGNIESSVLAQSLRDEIADITTLRGEVQASILNVQGDNTVLTQSLQLLEDSLAQAHQFIDDEMAVRLQQVNSLAAQIDAVGIASLDAVSDAILAEQAARAAAIMDLATSTDANIDNAIEGVRTEFESADAATLSSAQTYTYSRSAIDFADAAILTQVQAEYVAADTATLNSSIAYAQSYAYSYAAADEAIADAVDTVSVRLNSGGDVYNSIVSTQSIASAKSANFVQGTAPTNPSNGVALRTGDLWLNTAEGNKVYRWNGTAWVVADDVRIGASASQITVLQSDINKRNKVFRQNDAPVSDASYTLTINDLWYDTNDGNKAYLWSGAAWVLAADARIASTQATLINDYSTTVTMDSAIASATTSLQSEFEDADSLIIADLSTNYRTTALTDLAIASSTQSLAAQIRGTYTGSDLNALSTGLLFQERTVRASETAALSQQITLLSAGAGEQFDYASIYYFDVGVEGWTATATSGSIALTFNNGWIKAAATSGTATDPKILSPDNLDLLGSKYTQVRARVRKYGTPTWDGRVYFTTTTDNTFDGTKSAVLDEPSYDSNGISVLTWDMPAAWTSATIRRLRLDLAVDVTTANYFEVDWVAVGRPSPGASSAQLAAEQLARADGDSAEATSRETLAAQVRGAYTGTDLALAAGLIGSERTARATADGVEVAARQALSAKLTGANDPASLTLDTLSSGLIFDERAARVTATTAAASRLTVLEATVNNGATGVAATATALDAVELLVTHASTGNTALGVRTSLIESEIGNATTGLSATALALDVVETLVNNGTTGVTAQANRVSILETAINSPTTVNNPTYALIYSQYMTGVNTTAAIATAVDAVIANLNSPTGVYSSIVQTKTTAESKNASFVQGSAPTATKLNDLWVDTANGNQLKRWNGSAWVVAEDTRLGTSATSITTLQSSILLGNKGSMLPGGFEEGNTYWTHNRAGDPTAMASSTGTKITNDVHFGNCLEVTTFDAVAETLCTKGVVPVVAGRIYRVKARFKVTAGDGAANFQLIAHGLDSAYASTTSSLSTSTAVSTGVITELSAVYADTASLGVLAWPAASTHLRIGLRLNSTEVGLVFRTHYITVEDITDEVTISAAVQTEASTRVTETGALFAQYTVKTDLNGYVAGYGLASEAVDGVPSSMFMVRADSFSIAPPTNFSQEGTPITSTVGHIWNKPSTKETKAWNGTSWVPFIKSLPFVVRTTETNLNGYVLPPGTYMDAAFIVNLSAEKIDTRGLVVRRPDGSVLLSSGVPITATDITPATGWVNSNITVSNGVLSGIGTPSVLVDNSYNGIDSNANSDPNFAKSASGALGHFSVPANWAISTTAGENSTAGASGTGTGATNDMYFSRYLAAEVGEKWYIRARIKINSSFTNNGGLMLGFESRNAALTNLNSWPSTILNTAVSGGLVRDTWIWVEAELTVAATTAAYIRPFISIRNTALAGTVQVSYWYMGKVAQGATVGAPAGTSVNGVLAETLTVQASTAAADASAANALLTNIASDSKLTPVEKQQVRKEWDEVYGERAGIRTQADALNSGGAITAAKASYDASFQALGTYLNAGTWTIGATPPLWLTDAQLSVTTDITGSTFRSTWLTFYVDRQALLNKIADEASKRATWSSVTGTGKPQDNATVGAPAGSSVNGVLAEVLTAQAATAASDASAANTALTAIFSDSVMSRAEKPEVIVRWLDLATAQGGIDAQAAGYGITVTRTAYNTAISTLQSYLVGLTPAWDNVAVDTPVNGVTLRGYFSAAYTARQNVLDAIATSAKAATTAAASTAASATTALTNKLNKNAADTLSGVLSVDATTAAGLRVGNLVWNTAGARVSGYGVAVTPGGLVGYNSAGEATFNLNASTGALALKGDISGSSGQFVGSVSINGALWSNTTDGFWTGIDGGVAKMRLGNATSFLKWSPSAGLELKLNTFTGSVPSGALTNQNTGNANGERSYGTRSVTVTGGVAPFTYQWEVTYAQNDLGGVAEVWVSSGGLTATVGIRGIGTNCANTASAICTITDSNGRVAKTSFQITQWHGTGPA